MSSFLQDGTGDLALTANKRLTLVTDPVQCGAAKLTNRFLLFLGEWFLDTRIGLPFYQQIAVKNPSIRALTALFQKVVLSTPPIVAINTLQVTVDSRRRAKLLLDATCDTGQHIVGGEGGAFIVQ